MTDYVALAFDYNSLPRNNQRRYLPAGLKFEWEGLASVFQELKDREISSIEYLERWLADGSEFDAYIYEQRAIRYINNSRQTDNAGYRKAYEDYVNDIEPKVKTETFELLKKYASSPLRSDLDQRTYAMMDKKKTSAVDIFRQPNVELEKKDSTLAQEYERTVGAMVVSFRGQERTLQQMSKFYEETDRDLRKEAWKLVDERFLRDADVLDRLYDDMVGLRDSISRNAGFDNYRDYIFRKKDRFDYGPQDCLSFHQAVEECFVPLSREIDEDRIEKLGVDTLMPWDLRVDPSGRPPLSPYADVPDLVSGCAKVARAVDPQLGGYFSKMSELRLLDLDSRKGKAPGGYQEDLSEARLPFIFMNAARRDNDVRTLLHESGHSFHTFLMSESNLPFFNSGPNLPTEFAEVASTTMELIGGEHLEGVFYTPEQAARSNREELVSMVKLFAWVATIDAFQHWVYTHPGHSHQERAEAWVKTFIRFAGLESYDEDEKHLRYRWMRQLHIFEVPFYYIEYGIATLGALGLWTRYRTDPGGAVLGYKEALSLGGSRPLPELFRAARVEWGLGGASLRKYSDALRAAIREYD
ncbi:MAG: M3 family oligoendopeptidase [Thaumarchaeota archaeon]|nr:M3 family oligoendopeptidase [Nitrososphaerota archaeon]